MRHILICLAASGLLGGCAQLSSITPLYQEGKWTSQSLKKAYEMGSAHAGLQYCAASVDPQALSLHKAVALKAALSLPEERQEHLRKAFDFGLRDGGGVSSPHRVPCSEATQVLNCSLEDYLKRWRAHEPRSK